MTKDKRELADGTGFDGKQRRFYAGPNLGGAAPHQASTRTREALCRIAWNLGSRGTRVVGPKLNGPGENNAGRRFTRTRAGGAERWSGRSCTWAWISGRAPGPAGAKPHPTKTRTEPVDFAGGAPGMGRDDRPVCTNEVVTRGRRATRTERACGRRMFCPRLPRLSGRSHPWLFYPMWG